MMVTLFPLTAFAAGEPPVLQAADVTAAGQVWLTFDKAMSIPGSGAQGFTVADEYNTSKEVTAVSLSGDSTKILLTLGTTIKGGEATWLGYTPGTMKAVDGGELANIVYFPIANTRPHPTLDINSPPAGTAGTLYSHSFTATGGTGPYSFHKSSGSLPGGLTLGADGVLSGTPTAIGNFTFKIMVTDLPLAIDEHEFSITIGAAAVNVCEISGSPSTRYPTLTAALAAVVDGQTITLLKDINYSQGITIDGEDITFNLNGHTLNVTAGSTEGLKVINGGKLNLFDDSGAFNVTGYSYGVWVEGAASTAQVTNAWGADSDTNVDSTGAYVTAGGKLTVKGNAIGSKYGAVTSEVGEISIGGNAEANAPHPYDSFGAWAESGGVITITGDAISLDRGIYAIGPGSEITVRDARSTGTVRGHGAQIENMAKAFIRGNCMVDSEAGTGIFVSSHGEVTIDGTIAAKGTYIKIYPDIKDGRPPSRTVPTTKDNYYTYSTANGTVWVKAGLMQKTNRIATGFEHSLYLKEDGTVWSWGYNANNQLGYGPSDNGKITPIQVAGLSDIIAVEAGHKHSLALDADGYVWCWGNNEFGQQGNGTTNGNEAAPRQVAGVNNVAALAAGWAHTLALKTDGTVWAWGYNSQGQLGDNTEITRTIPFQVPGLSGIVAIAAGNQHSLALKNDGTIWAWGGGGEGQLANIGSVKTPGQITGLAGVTGIYASGHNSLALVGDDLYIWGDNVGGQLGDGQRPTDSAVPIPILSGIETAAGSGLGSYFLARKTDHTVWIWGDNSVGQLGTGDNVNHNIPVQNINFGGFTDFAVAEGSSHGLALKSDGTLYAWGYNNHGQLGDDSTTDRNAPIAVQFEPSAPVYTLTVENGSGGGSYAAGTMVNIVAASPSFNYSFSGWTSSNGGTFANESSASTTFTMPGNATVITAGYTYIGGSSGNSTPSASKQTGNAMLEVSSQQGNIVTGGGNVVISVPPTGVDAYSLGISTDYLSNLNGEGTLTFHTDTGSITLPSNMLTGVSDISGSKAEVTIGKGDKSAIPEHMKAAIGDKPLIQLTLSIDGKQTDWSNRNAPVTVSVPYTPTAAELANPESIVVWYLDGSGKAVSVPNGRYDPATGRVTFFTTHFSDYAVAYVHKTFSDLSNVEWARKAIEVMASKGITSGTGNSTFSPRANITRADYMVLLINTLDLTADFTENFDDVKPGTYYYNAAGTAKKLGIATGSGNNRFNPTENISRQDMMVLANRALEKYQGLKAADNNTILEKFSDKKDIAEYAAGSLSTLANEGWIEGSGNKLNPRSAATRAEVAVFLYSIYNKYPEAPAYELNAPSS